MEAELYKSYTHTPPHFFRPNGKYFITGSTYRKQPHLKSDAAKAKAVEYMVTSFEHFGWKIEDWVLLNNHYHIMADAPEDALTLSAVINNFHKFSAIWIRKNVEPGDYVTDKLTQSTYSKNKIWYSYWDTCITYEKYIWCNPVKHGYVTDPTQWRFGSFFHRAKDWSGVKDIIEKYPWDRVGVKDDF